MKKIFCTCLLLIAVLQCAAQQPWTVQHPTPHGNDFLAIHAFDSLHALAVGDFSSMMETFDGGRNWIYRTLPLSDGYTLQTIYFTDGETGWAAGSLFTMLHTKDGGKSWQKQNTIDMQQKKGTVTKIHLLNKDQGWAVGYRHDSAEQDQFGTYAPHTLTSGGIILHTVNGGETWEEVKPFDSIPPLYNIHFYDSNTGWAVGSHGTLLHTADGGATWERSTIPQLSDNISDLKVIMSVSVLSSTTVLITNTGGRIFRTENNGETWTEIKVPDYQNFNIGNYLFFTDSLRGYAYSNHTDYFTTEDGGHTWQMVKFPDELTDSEIFTSTFNSLSAAPDGSLWLAGRFGLIFRSVNGGNRWQRMNSATEKLWQVYFVGDQSGWAVGTANTLLATADAGKTWTPLLKRDKKISLQHVFFLDQYNGWLIESNTASKMRSLLYTANGGKNWSRRFSDSLITFSSLHFFDLQNGVATQMENGTHTLVITKDGGKTWNNTNSFDSGVFPYAFSFTGRFNGWLTGSHGLLLNTKDGGMTWNTVDAGTQSGLYSIHFRDSLNGWIGGQNGTILSTTDGGATWQAKTHSGLTGNITSILFTDGLHGVVIAGYLFETNDGGVTWHQQSESTPVRRNYNVTPSRITSSANGSFWAVGDKGFILHRAGTGTSVTEDVLKENNLGIAVYPNPASGTIQISINDNKKGILTITDALGKELTTIVTTQSEDSFTAKFDTVTFPSGSYFLQWKSSNKQETIPLLIAR